MATYQSPTVAYIEALTQANFRALGVPASDLDSLMADWLDVSEAYVAGVVTEEKFSSDGLSAIERTNLRTAVAYRVASCYLRACASRKADGTFTNLLVEGSKSLGELADEWDVKAQEHALLVARGEGTLIQSPRGSFSLDTPPMWNREMGW